MFMRLTLIILLILAPFGDSRANHQDPTAGSNIVSSYDATKNRTTVRSLPVQIGADKGKYHSLKFSLVYSYPGATKRVPESLNLELLTVVKARLLDPDLYVVFIADGQEILLSSDRSAVPNPVRGKRWIGERLIFRVPYETFLKFARAKRLTVRLDAVQFDFLEEHLHVLREFARDIKR